MILDRGDTESGFSGPFPGQHLLSLHSKEHSSFEDPVNGPQSSGPSCYGFGPTGAPAHSPFSRALRALTTLSADHPGVRLVPSVKLPERPLLQTPPSPVFLLFILHVTAFQLKSLLFFLRNLPLFLPVTHRDFFLWNIHPITN